MWLIFSFLSLQALQFFGAVLLFETIKEFLENLED